MRIIFLVVACTLIACSKDNKEKFETTTFTVASQLGTCTGWTGIPNPCLQIKEGISIQWRGFSEQIEGFNYEQGFEYVIEVKIYDLPYPVMDASGKRYVLNRIISKQ